MVCPAIKMEQLQQRWDHDRTCWDHWRVRVHDELEAAKAEAAGDARRCAAEQLALEAQRAQEERAALEHCWAMRLQEAEQGWSERFAAATAAAAGRLEEAQQRGQAEAARAGEAAALRAAGVEARYGRTKTSNST